jgi:hypothetical protein
MRERLEDFAAGRLGPQATGEVQGHLLECQECAELFGTLLMAQVVSGDLPELTPPNLPPQSLYERYLRARRPTSSWRLLLEALSDAASRERTAARLEEIRAGFELFAHPLYAGGAQRMRGGPGAARSNQLTADVLTPAGEPSGATVNFDIESDPRITGDSHFVMTLSIASSEYDGRVVVCSIALPAGEAVSFEAVVERRAEGDVRIVRFDVADLPISHARIPVNRVSLAML